MARQNMLVCVAEPWGFYTGSGVYDPADLPALAPDANKARMLVKRSPQDERPLIFKDLTAMACAMQRARTGPLPLAIYRLRSGWHLFTFTPNPQ